MISTHLLALQVGECLQSGSLPKGALTAEVDGAHIEGDVSAADELELCVGALPSLRRHLLACASGRMVHWMRVRLRLIDDSEAMRQARSRRLLKSDFHPVPTPRKAIHRPIDATRRLASDVPKREMPCDVPFRIAGAHVLHPRHRVEGEHSSRQLILLPATIPRAPCGGADGLT